MHLSEFKAWFDGFTENIKGQPTAKQWARIKERVGEINAEYTPERIFYERHWYPYRPYWPTYTTSGTVSSPLNYTVSITDWTDAGRAENASVA